MIVREVGGFHYVVRQPEHARQSAQIIAHLRPEFLGDADLQYHLLRSTHHHDDGWHEWEANPRKDERGLPVNFTGITAEESFDNWERGIFHTLMKKGARTAVFIAAHAGGFLAQRDEDTAEASRELIEAIAARGWPELSPAHRGDIVNRGFQALRFGDTLSLLACAGWDGGDRAAILLDGEGREVHFACRHDGPWTIRISPWPFVQAELRNIHLDAVALPKVGDWPADVLEWPRDFAVRIAIDYLPEAS